MTIRKLPEIKAFDGLSALQFEPDNDALARWNPAVQATTEGDDNVISIYDVIGADFFGEGITTKRVAAALRRIGQSDITVNLNSPGGDFFEGIGIYGLLREHPAKITVKIMGLAASAASVIAMAGDDIRISEVGFLMVHNAWGVTIGNRHDHQRSVETLTPFDDAMASLYAARAEVDKAEAAKWMDDETWFNGSGAVDAGLADGLLSPGEISEADTAGTKSLAAVRRVEAALAKQGLSRNERRSLIAEMRGGMPSAAVDSSAVASDALAGLRRLIETIKS